MASFGNSFLAGLSGLSSPAAWQTPARSPAPAPPSSDMSLARTTPAPAGPSLGLQSPDAFATASPVIDPKAWAASDIAPTPAPSMDATLRQRPIEPMVSMPMPNFSSATQPLTPEQAAAAAASVASPASAPGGAPVSMPRMGGGGGGAVSDPSLNPWSDSYDMMKGRALTGPQREGVRLGQELWEQQGATKEMVAQSQAEGLQVAAQQQKNAIDQQMLAEKQRQSEREVYKQAYDSRIAELDAARKDIAASGPSVGKFWDDAGFLGSVAAIVATGLGEYTAIKTGQPNRAGEMLDEAIDRSLKMQMAQLENKKDAAAMQNTILGQMRQKFGDEEAAYSAAKVMMHDLAAQKLAQISTQYQGRTAAVVANSLGDEQRLQGKLATNAIAQGAAEKEVVKRNAATAAAASEAMRQRKLLEEQNKEIFKSGLAVAEADAKKNGGQTTVLRGPMQIGDQIVPAGTPIVMGADGTPRLPTGEGGTLMVQPFMGTDPTGSMVLGDPVRAKSAKDAEEYAKARDALAEVKDNIQRLRQFHEQNPSGKFVDGNDGETVKTISNEIVQGFRRAGQSSDMDARVNQEMYGANPLKKEVGAMLGVTEHSSKVRLDNLERMVDAQLQRAAQSHLKGQPNGLNLGKPK